MRRMRPRDTEKQRTYRRIMHDDQDIRIFRQLVQNSRELLKFHVKRVKLFALPCTRMLERLDQFRRPLITGRRHLMWIVRIVFRMLRRQVDTGRAGRAGRV